MSLTVEQILADEAALNEVTKSVFESVDTDGSGTIDRRELKAAMTDVARMAGMEAPSEASIDQALTALDQDQSGTIDVEEFKVLIRQLLQALR